MQVTFIIRNLTEETLNAIAAMEPRAMYDKLFKWAYGDLKHCVSVKYGTSDAFRDRVEWNGKMKSNAPLSAKMEPCKGYKLVTFEA